MSAFDAAYELTVETWERFTLSHVPGDTGGKTFAGISQKWFPEWNGWALIGQGDEIALRAAVRDFYRTFWDKLRCEEMPVPVAKIVFDTRVLQGPHPAGFVLQRGMNIANNEENLWDDLVEDGWIGNNTVRAVTGLDELLALRVSQAMVLARAAMVYHLIAKNPKNEKFFGWVPRVLDREFLNLEG